MTSIRKGDSAPSIEGFDQNGNIICIENFKGKKIILYFYPKDLTPGCTTEACNLRDNYSLLVKNGFVVIGVSADSQELHRKFIDKYNLPFSLIADVDKKIIKAFGAWGEKNMYGKKFEGIIRSTFIINESGKIEEIISKVDTNNHYQQILDAFKG